MSKDNEIKIFKNKELTEEIKDEIFHFGIVPAGETKRITFWILNVSPAYVKELEFSFEHEEVKIIEAPKELFPNENKELTIEWAASVTIKKGLKLPFKINGQAYYGG